MAQTGRLTKQALLEASDLEEKDVELPSLGGSVRIRSLSAYFSDEATGEALEMTETRGGQKVKVNTAKLNAIKVQHGVIDPKLDTLEEAAGLLRKSGKGARVLINAINEISGIDDDEVEKTDARFQDGG